MPEEKIETVMSSPSGYLNYSMTGFKILGISIAVIFLVAFFFGLFNPDALEPER